MARAPAELGHLDRIEERGLPGDPDLEVPGLPSPGGVVPGMGLSGVGTPEEIDMRADRPSPGDNPVEPRRFWWSEGELWGRGVRSEDLLGEEAICMQWTRSQLQLLQSPATDSGPLKCTGRREVSSAEWSATWTVRLPAADESCKHQLMGCGDEQSGRRRWGRCFFVSTGNAFDTLIAPSMPD